MRSLMFLLVLVLFCSVQMTSSAAIATDKVLCCMEFSDVKIPVRLVKSYYWTSKCKDAIVLHTFKGKDICVDPETSWVNGHIAIVDRRTKV